MDQKKNEILVLLTDRWCDWEASYAIAAANSFSNYVVKTIAIDRTPKVSMGGIRSEVDYTISEYANFDNLAIFILPGGLSWAELESPELVNFIQAVSKRNILVAAICGATYYLCKNGFLNHIKHTGDSPELFQRVPGYTGASQYVKAQVVMDGGFITANETAAVAFAYEIFKALHVDIGDDLEEWYNYFKNGSVH